jgi:hypothetical protein
MALSRLFGGWIAVVVWLLLWELVAARLGAARGDGRPTRSVGPTGMPATGMRALRARIRARVHLGEALLLTLLGALWFGSLGAGGWWLVFGLVGALREWPVPRGRRPAERPDPIVIGLSLLLVLRTVVAGGLLAWRLAPA